MCAYEFLLTFHSNHGPVSYRFRDRRRFQSKIAKVSPPLVFCAPVEGFPLELGTCAGSQTTRMMGLPGRQRSLTISSAVWIECTNRRTDGHRATAKTALTHAKIEYIIFKYRRLALSIFLTRCFTFPAHIYKQAAASVATDDVMKTEADGNVFNCSCDISLFRMTPDYTVSAFTMLLQRATTVLWSKASRGLKFTPIDFLRPAGGPLKTFLCHRTQS